MSRIAPASAAAATAVPIAASLCHSLCAAMLGLEYSDDEDEGQTTTQTQSKQTPTSSAGPPTATDAPSDASDAPAAIAGLLAYADSDDEEDESMGTSTAGAGASEERKSSGTAPDSTAVSTAASQAKPLLIIGGVHLAPLKSVAGAHTVWSVKQQQPSSLPGQRTGYDGGSSAAAASSASTLAAASSTAALPAAAAHRSASTSDLSALAAKPLAPLAAEDESDEEAAALHERVQALLPPGPPHSLWPSLATRHAANLARARALRDRASKLPASAPPVPSFVESLQNQPAFHNPYILARLASETRGLDPYASNLSRAFWREQNLPTRQSTAGAGTEEGKTVAADEELEAEEEDYLVLREQSKQALQARLTGRNSIEFAPSAAASAFNAAFPSVASAVPPSSLSSSSSSGGAGGGVNVTVNPDGSITRVRVFTDDAAAAPAAAASAAAVPVPSSSDASTAAATGRKSKWGAIAQNPPPLAQPTAPAANPAAAAATKRTGDEGAAAEASKKQRL